MRVASASYRRASAHPLAAATVDAVLSNPSMYGYPHCS